MKLRKTFTSSFVISPKRRFINKRTISSVTDVTTVRPLLLIDLNYFEHLILRYIDQPNSNLSSLVGKNLLLLSIGNTLSKNIEQSKKILRVKQKILEIYKSLLKPIIPEKICLFSVNSSKMVKYIRYILEPLGLSEIHSSCESTHSFVFNFLKAYKDINPIYLFTNDVSSWMFSDLENKYNLCFTILSKNNQCISFNNTTCGELVCKILNSTKPNHKLGFDILKNISFQYIFFLMLGLKFFYKNKTSDSEFYLDASYFREINKITIHEKFLRATGKGLEYLQKMHKTFYFILKNNSFISIFLYSTKEELDIYLANSSIQYQDKFLLSSLKDFYDKTERLSINPIQIPDLKILKIKTELLDYWYKDSLTLSYFCHKQSKEFLLIPESLLFNRKLFYATLKKLIRIYKKFPTKYRTSLSKDQVAKYLYLYTKANLKKPSEALEKTIKEETKLSDILLDTDEESFVDSLIHSYLF